MSNLAEWLILARESVEVASQLDSWKRLRACFPEEKAVGGVVLHVSSTPDQNTRLSERFNCQVRSWVDEEINTYEKQLADLRARFRELFQAGEPHA